MSHSPVERDKLQKFFETKGLNPSAQLLKKFTSESPSSIRGKDKQTGELMMKYKINISKNLLQDFKQIHVNKENKKSYQDSNLNNIFWGNTQASTSGKVCHKSMISSKDIINAAIPTSPTSLVNPLSLLQASSLQLNRKKPVGSSTAVEASKSDDDLIITDILSDNVGNSMVGIQN